MVNASPVVWSAERSRRRLLLGVVGFALALGAPLALLMKHVYEQLRVEAFAQLASDADELSARIDRRAEELLAAEEARRFEEFTFLNVLGNAWSNSLQLSPLSKFPADSRLPGLVGYFQLDPEGHYSTPLLPRDAKTAENLDRYGIDVGEFSRRRQRENEILEVLNANDIAKGTGPAAAKEAEFQLAKSQKQSEASANPYSKNFETAKDAKTMPSHGIAEEESDLLSQAADLRKAVARPKKELAEKKIYTKHKQEVTIADSFASVQDTASDAGAPAAAAPKSGASAMRGQGGAAQASAPSRQGNLAASAKASSTSVATIRTFQGELDPFQFGFLTSGHVVLYRKVWRDGKRYIQGALMERDGFLHALFRDTYDESPLSTTASLTAYHGNDLLATFAPDASSAPARKLFSKHLLAAPFDAVSLFFTVNRVVVGPSVAYVGTICGLVLLVLAAGTLTIFKAGQRQIALSQQQRDFVSAVSHELKTPLTSIRMYSEMLREGWAEEGKKRGYYDFIFSESERLSRLISNVLQLARLSRGQTLAAEKITASEAYRRVAEVIATQIDTANFKRVEILPKGESDPLLAVDADALTQIFVNLVDNSIKFSQQAALKSIEIGYELSPTRAEVRFIVRDFGPGIPKDQLKRIFKLFYRPENELTRTTKGTGIGLALVNDLTAQMGGRVDVESRPGLTEFRVILPVTKP